jgi:hypothetical protein
MADDPTKHAIDVVARRVILYAAIKSGFDDHELYPEIGENDWRAVSARVTAFVSAQNPTDEQYQAAYEHLEQRASESYEETP